MRDFYYFHVPSNLDGQKIATIAVRPSIDGTAAYGVAVRSPKDNFSRKAGRILASGRCLSKQAIIASNPEHATDLISTKIYNIYNRHSYHLQHAVVNSYLEYMTTFLKNQLNGVSPKHWSKSN